MKKFLFVLVLVGAISVANAQFFNFGVKGGFNYNSNGDLRIDNLPSLSSNEESGYHFGVLAEIKLPFWMYIRPELLYTHTESSYKGELNKTKLKLDKLDMPVLVGFRIFGIGRFFFGPTFQYIIDTSLNKTTFIDNIEKISSDDFTVGGLVGVGLDLGRIGIDFRWEKGFSESEAQFIGDVIGKEDPVEINIDTRPQQFILSFYYKFK